MRRDTQLSIQDVEQWRRTPVQLASGETRNGKRKEFKINADGWAYVYVGPTLVATFTELQAAITYYNER